MKDHVKEQNTTYLNHFKHAFTTGLALIIHAFLPNVLETYASDKICKK